MAFVPTVLLSVLLFPAGAGVGERSDLATDAPPADAKVARQSDTGKDTQPARTARTTAAKPRAATPAPVQPEMPSVLRIANDGAWAATTITVLDAKKIYFGKADNATKPATVKAKTVYAQIPEYKEILRRGLTKDDIEYWTLMRKASKKFKAAIKKAAGTEGKDLVAEAGAIEVKGETIPDMTAAVIAALGA